jgi:hypothetical protein
LWAHRLEAGRQPLTTILMIFALKSFAKHSQVFTNTPCAQYANTPIHPSRARDGSRLVDVYVDPCASGLAWAGEMIAAQAALVIDIQR